MGQFFDRVSRVIRANLNSNPGDSSSRDADDAGAALVAGGAVAGASLGKAGLLVGGTGYSVGAVPLAALGALTGTALYEALRSLLENDTSSAGAAATGAAVGAATSAVVGSVGVAAGGSAIGVGMAAMAAGGAVVGLGLVGLQRLFQRGIDPEKLLERAIEEMQADTQNAQQALVNLIATQKRLQQQYNQAQTEVDNWARRARLALQKGDEFLAREALLMKRRQAGPLSTLKTQLDQQLTSVQHLQRNLTLLETKIADAKVMRTRLKAQIAEAQANGQLQRTVGVLGTSSAMSVYERMEDKVLQMEARSQAAAELAGADLESQFAQLESGSDVDDELAVLKVQLLTVSVPNQTQLSSPHTAAPKSELAASQDADFDAELEDLKRQLDQL